MDRDGMEDLLERLGAADLAHLRVRIDQHRLPTGGAQPLPSKARPVAVVGTKKNRTQRPQAVDERRIAADGRRQDLSMSDRAIRVGRRGGHHQFAGLTHDEQPIAGEYHRTCMKTIDTPFDGTGVQIDCAKAWIELLPPVKSVQVSVGVDARRVMIREHLV